MLAVGSCSSRVRTKSAMTSVSELSEKGADDTTDTAAEEDVSRSNLLLLEMSLSVSILMMDYNASCFSNYDFNF